jgi:hypothetical protein
MAVAARADADSTPSAPVPDAAAASAQPTPVVVQAAPPAYARGVQGGFKFGAAIPGGSGAKGVDLSAFSGTQFWFDAELGGKLSESVFVGGMLGTGLSSPGDALASQCSSCSTLTLELGPIVRYYFAPGKAFDPWVNASTAFSLLGVSNGERSGSGRVQGPVLVGLEILKAGVGFDWRASQLFGVGPYLDVGFGSYLAGSNVEPFSAAIHTWVSLGVRFSLRP